MRKKSDAYGLLGDALEKYLAEQNSQGEFTLPISPAGQANAPSRDTWADVGNKAIAGVAKSRLGTRDTAPSRDTWADVRDKAIAGVAKSKLDSLDTQSFAVPRFTRPPTPEAPADLPPAAMVQGSGGAASQYDRRQMIEAIKSVVRSNALPVGGSAAVGGLLGALGGNVGTAASRATGAGLGAAAGVGAQQLLQNVNLDNPYISPEVIRSILPYLGAGVGYGGAALVNPKRRRSDED